MARKKWLMKEMYSTHNKGKSIAAEWFIWPPKYKIYKYMISISENVYIDKLNEKDNKCNTTYYWAKPGDVNSNMYVYLS